MAATDTTLAGLGGAPPQRRHRAVDVERQLAPEPASEDREIMRAHAAGEKEIHVAHECRRRSVGDHAPALHQDQPIRPDDRIDLVLDRQQHEPFAPHALERGVELAPADGIEIGRGLVEEQHVRLHGEDAGDREPLFLAAGERRGIAADERRQIHERERALDPRRDLRRWHTELSRPKRDLETDVGAKELGLEILEHHRHPTGERTDLGPQERQRAEADLATAFGGRERGHERVDAAEQRRLAGAGLAHDGDELAGRGGRARRPRARRPSGSA